MSRLSRGAISAIADTTDDLSEDRLIASGTNRPAINNLQFNIRKDIVTLLFKCSVYIIEDTLRKNMAVHLPHIGVLKVKRTRRVAQEELEKLLKEHDVDNINQLPDDIAEKVNDSVRINTANRLRDRIRRRQAHNHIAINFASKKIKIVGKKVE